MASNWSFSSSYLHYKAWRICVLCTKPGFFSSSSKCRNRVGEGEETLLSVRDRFLGTMEVYPALTTIADYALMKLRRRMMNDKRCEKIILTIFLNWWWVSVFHSIIIFHRQGGFSLSFLLVWYKLVKEWSENGTLCVYFQCVVSSSWYTAGSKWWWCVLIICWCHEFRVSLREPYATRNTHLLMLHVWAK